MANYEQIREVIAAVESGSIEKATKEQLSRYITWLAEPRSQGHFGGEQYSQVFEVVRLNMLRAMIEAFEDRTKVTNRWVLFFAVLAIAATLTPYIIAPNPIFGATPSLKESVGEKAQGSAPAQPSAASIPVQAQPPSSGPTEATQANSSPTSAGQK